MTRSHSWFTGDVKESTLSRIGWRALDSDTPSQIRHLDQQSEEIRNQIWRIDGRFLLAR
jgi:hypothetical protein